MTEYSIYKEIHNQPETWNEIIEEYENNKESINRFLKDVDTFIFTGCGSGYNAAVYSKNVGEFFLNRCCLDYQASEIKFYGDKIYKKKNFKRIATFLFSRSGETTEIVEALDHIKEKGFSKTFGITCNEDSYLYNNCDFSFSLREASEEAVVTTKSFTSMALLPILIFNDLAKQIDYYAEIKRLPEYCSKLIEKYEEMSKRIGEDTKIDKFFILSNTPNFGLAREMKLKLLEMTLSWSDCFNTLDFRHGPRATVDENTLVIFILSDQAIDHDFKLAEEIAKKGGKLLIFGDIIPEKFFGLTDNNVEIGVKLSEWIRGILFLPVVHLISYYRAIKKNLNPDSPRDLTYFVKIG